MADKNGGIFIPIKLSCGLCSVTTEIWGPVRFQVWAQNAWQRGEFMGDLAVPKLQQLDLQGWKIEFDYDHGATVTCPRCLADRDNARALEKKEEHGKRRLIEEDDRPSTGSIPSEKDPLEFCNTILIIIGWSALVALAAFAILR